MYKGKVFEGGPSGQGSSDWAPWFYCPFKAYARQHSLGGKDGSSALDLGSAIHQVEAHHYLRFQARQEGRDPDEWLPPLEAVPVAIARGILNPMPPSEIEKVGAIYLACHNPNQTRGKKVVSVEEIMAIELGPLHCPGHPKHGEPIVYAPRGDLTEEDENGGVWLSDHKTASRPAESTIAAYSNHMQFIMLAAIGQAYYGDRFKGVKCHLIKTTEPYGHDWVNIPITKFQVEAMLWNFQHVAHMRANFERDILQGNLNPLHLPRAVNEQVCRGRYSRCSAFDLCRNGSTMTPKLVSFQRKVR